jgi:nitric oxide reductase NorQ protein
MTRSGNGPNRRVIRDQVVHAPDHVRPQASETFVVTPQIEELVRRALAYLGAGYPIHLSGPAGTGKTTLALHVASKLRRPVTLIHGDDEFGSSDLVGGDAGYCKSRLVDHYVHSVLKEEETVRTLWVDNRLTTACRYGHTLVYDEFTRSRPEGNNVLLSVLGEGLLSLPKLRYAGEGYLKVDPEFRAIFTSNPEEYAGIHKSQDALMDRLIPIHVDHYERDTEVAITAARSGASTEDARRVVDLVRRFRRRGLQGHRPSIRAAIMIARVVTLQGASFSSGDRIFERTCRDVLGLDRTDARGSERPPSACLVEEELGRACDAIEAAVRESGLSRAAPQPIKEPMT